MALLNKQTVLEHLYKRLIETANNNVGFECDAGIVFEEIATDRIKTWLDEVQTVDAIPISWLEQHIKDAETLLWLEYARHLKSLLYTWNEKNDYSRAERKEE